MRPAILGLGLLSLAWLAAPVRAQDFTVCHAAAPLLEQVKASLVKGGLAALTPEQIQAMEQSLAQAGICFPSRTDADGSVVVLADGPAESLAAMAGMANKKVKAMAQFNPFPQMAFFLGSHDNEVGRPAEALQILDKGLLLSPYPTERLGASVHLLISERGAALNALKRFDEALKDYDDGLAIQDVADVERARFQRGRGFALTELGRLDEAENAYRESLKLAPGDTRALHELGYIAHLRGGAAKADSYLTTQAPASAAQDVPPEQRAKKPADPN